jgi:PKD repeat protein
VPRRLLVAIALCGLVGATNLSAQTLIPGFSQTVVPGPTAGEWNEAVGIHFESNGRMWVWERGGRVWFKDTTDAAPTLLLNISEEVGAWDDHGLLGFALDPHFRQNGYIYLLYVVDRYHLLNYGTPGYNPAQNQYNDATIGRLTRYTVNASDGFRSVDSASRFVLIGATKSTGIPILSITHGVGSLVFAMDGTLLVSAGDGASPTTADTGPTVSGGSFRVQALADGIIRPDEDVGAFRSQQVDSLNGKILRIDPLTGNGIPSNPFYDAAKPGSTRSKVWALGLRNPFRITLNPFSGALDPSVGDIGVLYIGDVGWETIEELDVADRPGLNFGWPRFEGLSAEPVGQGGYEGVVFNPNAPNPLYPASGCSQYFAFGDLLHEASQVATAQPPFVNPCNASQRIPSSIPQFLHARPVLDWFHTTATTRTPIWGPSGDAQTVRIGTAGSPVSGTQFAGNTSAAGVFYTGTAFPPQYQNTYFHYDWGTGWIKNITFDSSNNPVAVTDFLSGGGFGSVVHVAQHPIDGSLYYISWPNTIRKITYSGNRTPTARASADKYFGAGPLTVQFSSSGSSDPDGQALTYSWNFGDGSASSTQANPTHTFQNQPGPTGFVVTLTVTDSGGLSSQATLNVAVNSTPPGVTITSPADGTLFPANTGGSYNLIATVNDLESADAALAYKWQTILHHNSHEHVSPVDTNHTTTTDIAPTGCSATDTYYYRIILTVTDPQGLSTQAEVRLYPNCSAGLPPIAAASATPLTGFLPLAVSFSSGGSSDPEGAALTYSWTFGDGAVSSDPNPGHTYAAAGQYAARLSVSDGVYTTQSNVLQITVTNANGLPPVASASATPTAGAPPLVVNFSSAGSSDPEGAPLTYNWTFGDGATSTAANPSHTYAAVGVYVASLTVSDGANTASSNNITVRVGSTPAGLVAAYGFNEGTGTTAGDSSGQGQTGTINGATWTTAGKYGNALSFIGATSRVTVPDSPVLGLTTGMTLEAWVYPTAAPTGWRAIVHKDVDRYYLMASSDTSNRPAIGATFGSGNQNVYGPATLPTNTWRHLAATYDGTLVRLFVDGVEVANAPQTSPITTSTAVLTIGADFYGEYFQGLIDELRIYNRALSATEIQADMAAPVDSTGPVVSSVSPASGPATGGTSVTLTGANFASGATVQFGSAPATNVVVVSATTITAAAPPNPAGPVAVTVTNPDAQSGTLASGFTYVSTAPTVSSITPATGPTAGGTAVTITGTNF